MPSYIIIEFTEENVKDIISSTWLRGRKTCLFPSKGAEEKMKGHIPPSPEDEENGCVWEECPIRIITSRGKCITAYVMTIMIMI
jgi:hypothetical protein